MDSEIEIELIKSVTEKLRRRLSDYKSALFFPQGAEREMNISSLTEAIAASLKDLASLIGEAEALKIYNDLNNKIQSR